MTPIESFSSVVGIFDSGLGGLTVVRALLKLLPSVPIVYFGDTARFPYGNKGKETIQRYALENAQFLMKKGATSIMVACNTATALALPELQQKISIPVFGVIAAAAEKAAKVTKAKKIAIIGTTGTIRSKSYEMAIQRQDPSIEVFSQACPLLVSLIEEGSPSPSITQAIIEAYLNPLIQKGVDTILLGCTHYPVLKSELEALCPNSISFIDPAETASYVLASTIHFEQPEKVRNQLIYYVSDDPERFQQSGEMFLGTSLDNVSLANISHFKHL